MLKCLKLSSDGRNTKFVCLSKYKSRSTSRWSLYVVQISSNNIYFVLVIVCFQILVTV
uniref:Uncharacterized protein n=1 Tax=Arundo donax TaxID=35708 RepID=A0A0A9ELS2_ARUDO